MKPPWGGHPRRTSAICKEMHMRETIIRRVTNLLSVKSIVSLTLTGVFAYMAVMDRISQDFMTVYTMIITFYFVSQNTKESGNANS